jgi:hypothetical protein
VTTAGRPTSPIPIRRDANLPQALIFTDVVGALAAFGAMGLFVRPVAPAVAYTFPLAESRNRAMAAVKRNPEPGRNEACGSLETEAPER